jgi:unspecific monooxygenase
MPERDQTFAWFVRPYEMLRDCAREFGDTFTLRITGWGTQVVFSHPDAIRDVFAAGAADLHAGAANGFLRPLMGKGSLLLLEEETHRRQRKLILPAFHGLRLIELGDEIREISRSQSARWPEGRAISLLERLLEISLEVILGVVLGMVEGDERHASTRASTVALLRATTTSVASAGPEAAPADHSTPEAPARRVVPDLLRELHGLLAAEIARRRAGASAARPDVLGLLLGARDDEGRPIDDADLYDQLLTLIIGGHETTATSLAWAFRLLVENPEVDARLRAELAALGPTPPIADLVALPWLDAVVKETLRLRPVVPVVSRLLMRPLRLGGIDLPAGVFAAPSAYLAHHRAERYPEPERFRPERFLGADFGPSEFLPFGGGLRRCLGMGLALHEMKILLADVVSRFTVLDGAREPVRPTRRGVLLAPSGGARMVVRRTSRGGE